jgi:hypothetical protein
LILEPFTVFLPKEIHKHGENGKQQENVSLWAIRVPAQHRFNRKNNGNDQVGDLKEFKIFGHIHGVSSTYTLPLIDFILTLERSSLDSKPVPIIVS